MNPHRRMEAIGFAHDLRKAGFYLLPIPFLLSESGTR
jgi:hypothetical protein